MNNDLRRQLARDGFEIDKPAGGGGSSTVYRGREAVSGRLVAIKVLTDEGEDSRQRFSREAVVLADLSHPGIVGYRAHGEAGGIAYLITEWVDGETLAERLHGAGLTMADSIDLTRHLASALAAIHERGLVHRDVKPANIVFRERGGLAPVLIDFGIARSAMAPRAITGTGIMVGTPGFVSPEQARGLSTVGPASDIFSLGCVLHLMLTGRPPFTAAKTARSLLKIHHAAAQARRRSLPEAPVVLEDLLTDMLSKTPARRPADGAALLRRLELLVDLPAGRTISIGQPAEPSTRRRARSTTARTGAGTGSRTQVDVGGAVVAIGPGEVALAAGELERIVALATRAVGSPDVAALPQEVVLVQARHAHLPELVEQLVQLVWQFRAELGDRVFCIAPAEEADWAVDTAQRLEMARLFADPEVPRDPDTVVIHESLAAMVPAPFTAEIAATGRVTVRRPAG